MYAELSDFFYVWLKRTAGLLFPEGFAEHLTDKDREAVANPAKFKGQKGTKELAGQDYEQRMAAIFKECRRVLKPDGIMTVMFTHKARGAWDALASGLVRAGFVITASWPINTEAEGSLHIKEKSAAKSTIFLVCRVREERGEHADAIYWEDVEPRVAEAVRRRIGEFQAAGIGGIDLYLACFGPALQVFSEAWPLTRGRPITRTNGKKAKKGALPGDDDPYAVRPEDALDAARREVKRWRMEQLATVKRQHHLDPLTEWFVLAWDAFKAPKFPVDEALKLARVVGLDFDHEVKNNVCGVKGSDVTLWDSLIRKRKGKLGAVGGAVMLDTHHQAAALGREQNTGAAKAILENADLLGDNTLMTALEALLNVLPPPALFGCGKKDDGGLSGAAADFDALEKLRRLAFAESVPEPKVLQQMELPLKPADAQGEFDLDDAEDEAEAVEE
jgi:putative DNA methylase